MTQDRPPISREALERMTPAEVNAAFDAGDLDHLLGRTGPRHATGPLTAAELADLHAVPYRRLAQGDNLAQAERAMAAQAEERRRAAARSSDDAELLALYDRVDPNRARLIRALDKETTR